MRASEWQFCRDISSVCVPMMGFPCASFSTAGLRCGGACCADAPPTTMPIAAMNATTRIISAIRRRLNDCGARRREWLVPEIHDGIKKILVIALLLIVQRERTALIHV